MKRVAVIGAAAIGDYMFHVDHLPEKGEIVMIDQEPSEFIPGGCAPNISAGMKSLGVVEPVLYYPVGVDMDTISILTYWDQLGIEVHPTIVPGTSSGRAWLYMQSDGTTMCFSYVGAAGKAKAEVSDLSEEWVVIAPILNGFTEEYLNKAIELGKCVIATGIGNEAIVPYLAHLTYLLINKYEAGVLCEKAGFESIKELSAAFPDINIFVTVGSKGSCIYKNGTEKQIPIVSADRICDFTGAGDAYTSGLVSALADGYDPEISAYIGAANASFVLEQIGGMSKMPKMSDILERLQEQYPDIAERIKNQRS